MSKFRRYYLLNIAKVMEHMPSAGPPHPPLSPRTGERIKVRGPDATPLLHYIRKPQ
jgi:hypothetical protein